MAQRLVIIALSVLVLGSVHSQAQQMNEADSPCAGVVTTSDSVECLWKAKAASEAKLSSVYKEAAEKLDPKEVQQLAKTQELWSKYREANCSAERALYGLGTANTPAYLACLESMTRVRIKELRVTYAVRLK
jgi:uncharacterized protein YecT (DUF1311 family)